VYLITSEPLMKASLGFLFFLLFLAGIALLNLKSFGNRASSITDLSGLAGSQWKPAKIHDSPVASDSPQRLVFEADKGVNGHAGCNRFFGPAAIRDGELSIGPLATTRMACPEPIAAEETRFLDALHSARYLSRTASELSLLDSERKPIVTFQVVPETDTDGQN